MRDPYSKGFPGAADPANTLVELTEGVDLEVGVKSLRITNAGGSWVTIEVITATGAEISFDVPPNCVWIEPLRIRQLVDADGATVHGYTDL